MVKSFLEIISSSFFESLFTFLFGSIAGGVSVFSIISSRVSTGASFSAYGIKRLYPHGRNIKSLEKKMQNCKTIKVLGFSALGFTYSYRRILTEHIAKGGKLEFLLAKENSELVVDATQMEGRGSKAITNSIEQTLELLGAIKKDALKKAEHVDSICGSIEIRQYNTEIRNQLIICVDEKGSYAWMTILIPPKSASECRMIEYSDPSDCIDYYNVIWQRSSSTSEAI
jgi:hypothetical protein